MHREHHVWHSTSLNRAMELLVFGHAGARVIVYPTSQGRFYEWEDFGMLAPLSPHLENGWIQLYCVDSVDGESWYAKWAHPSGRIQRHLQYDQYIVDEVLPFSHDRNPNAYVMGVGASFGAFHVMSIGLRHPDKFNRLIGMSGLYDARHWTDGYYDENLYFVNPMDFVANVHDPRQLEMLRRQDIIVAVGRDDENFENNRQFSQILWDKGIWHAFRVWDGWAHDWPYWYEMIRWYIGGPDSKQ
ncbi:MAG: esterase family protein [Anaerolineae bacterium]